MPQKSMGGSAREKRSLSVSLHIRFPTDYPESVPYLSVKDPHGLTSDLVKELEQELLDVAKERKGEVSCTGGVGSRGEVYRWSW